VTEKDAENLARHSLHSLHTSVTGSGTSAAIWRPAPPFPPAPEKAVMAVNPVPQRPASGTPDRCYGAVGVPPEAKAAAPTSNRRMSRPTLCARAVAAAATGAVPWPFRGTDEMRTISE
jgi:hypothetical protein